MAYTVAPEFGDVIPLEEFREAVASNFFTDWDGFGHPMKDGLEDTSISVYPSTMEIPEDATHIAWYNK